MQSVKQEPGRTDVLAEIRKNFNSKKRVAEEAHTAVKRCRIAPSDSDDPTEVLVHTKLAATECPYYLPENSLR